MMRFKIFLSILVILSKLHVYILFFSIKKTAGKICQQFY